MSSANAVLQTKKQNWKVFLGSWSLVPQENQFQEVSMIVSDRIQSVKVGESKPQALPYKSTSLISASLVESLMTDPNHDQQGSNKNRFPPRCTGERGEIGRNDIDLSRISAEESEPPRSCNPRKGGGGLRMLREPSQRLRVVKRVILIGDWTN